MRKERYLFELLELIRVLKGPEIELVKKHLKAYASNHTIHDRKMFQLYKSIKYNDIQDYDKLKKIITPQSNIDSFNKLIRRTIGKIQESLIVDVNIKRKDSYNDVFKVKFFIRKQLMEGQILLGRGLFELSLKLFNSIIKRAKKFELYDELIEALSFKQNILTNKYGIEQYEKINNIIEYYINCRDLLREAKVLRESFNAQFFNKSLNYKITAEFELEVEKLKDYYKQTKSSNIISNYYLLKIEIDRSKRKDVTNLIKNFIGLLKESPSLYSAARIAYLYNELAITQINAYQFINSIEYSKKALKESLKSPFTYSMALLTKNKANLLMQHYNEVLAKDMTNSNGNNFEATDLLKIEKHQMPLFNYQKAIAYFGIKEYQAAQRLLSQKNEIEKDKEGWNVWIRIMRLLCMIELLKLNLIDYDIESFRKYLQRINKQYEVRPRDKMVLKVLLELDKQNYSFKKVHQTRKKELDLLASTDNTFKWNPNSPELILFHEWFKAKLNDEDYEPNFEIYNQ